MLNKLYEKYELTEYTDSYKLKILQVRYNIAINGYSLFKSIDLADDISYESVIMVEEIKNDRFTPLDNKLQVLTLFSFIIISIILSIYFIVFIKFDNVKKYIKH